MKINILLLIDRLSLGGTERQLLELIQNLDKNHFRPHLGTLRECERSLEENVPQLSLGFKAFYHPSTLRCVVALTRYIRENRIAIVQSFFQDPTLLAALSRPFHHARLIGSFRDLGFWRNRKETIKMLLAYRAYSGFIANSNAVKEHFVNVDGIDADKIKVIYNGISVDTQDRKASANPRNGPPLIGIVANLNRPVKRVQDFIQAAAIVRRLRPETRFLVVGDGYLRPQLEELSKSLGLSGALAFAGLVQDPSNFIAGLQVGVITSESEGFCNAILEYMACGVPVVATATGGNLEMVREGENGFLVSVGDIPSLADRILKLLQDEDLSQKMAAANTSKVRAEFSLPRMVSDHEAYYEGLLARCR